MDSVVHFEMPYEDKNRAAEFYAKTFGWKANMLGAEMGEYVVMHTAETDENNMLTKPGAINGGFFKRSKPEQGASVVIAVKDIHEAMKKVTEAGGTVLGGSQGQGIPDEIPGVGLYAAIIDTEGNRVGLMQSTRM